jgi:hypothetical protein
MPRVSVQFAAVPAAIFAGVLGIAGTAQAVDGTGNSTVNVVVALGISEVTPLDFGTVAPGSTAGTIVLTSAGAASETGGATYFSGATAGEFAITGDASRVYTIGLPTSVNLSGAGGPDIVVNAFESTPATTGTLDGSGDDSLSVGATLTLPSGQGAGVYNSTYTVTVNYQ